MAKYAYHHVHLLSNDAMAAGRFYESMFGAALTESRGANGLPRANLQLDGQTILISTASGKTNPPSPGPHQQIGMDHIGLRVTDMDQAVSELKRNGAEFTVEPREGRSGVRIAFLSAPDGVSVELVEYSD